MLFMENDLRGTLHQLDTSLIDLYILEFLILTFKANTHKPPGTPHYDIAQPIRQLLDLLLVG